ncbi:ORF82 peptide [Hyphantria cunea nucleopolyhedrovirus]|uniref:ORF82 peptide n=1 Tax=Hyphantria cunea nuclear polyhedrosis virus TaxID=28288 RepID=Q2NNZ0_NPVHC|nr:ORF82 peptide [Hyphantria cunea nucleopolyhedrovirus]BAE72371.1 ORF82 peptide [Hyphantria cunea nucleopolyhedrovirus]
MWNTIRWQILSSDEVEVAPEHRALAWRELIANVAYATPLNYTFRTMFQRADFENFDYNTPIVYNVKNKELIVLNERIRAALNRPVHYNDRTINVNTAHVLLLFILVVLLTVLVVFLPQPNSRHVATEARTTKTTT